MTALIRYEAARNALAVAVSYDEVRDIMDTAERAAVYARQAQDGDLIKAATEIRVRAQRRAGEMLALTEKSDGGRPSKTGAKQEPVSTPTLAEMGITKKQSSTWQSLASMSAEHFDAAVEAAKESAGEVTTAFMAREAKKATEPAARPKGKKPGRPKKKQSKKDKERMEELREAQARGVSMLSTYARLTLTALRSQTSFDDDELHLLEALAEAIQKVSTLEKVNT